MMVALLALPQLVWADDMDELYKRLDLAIERAPEYREHKERQLDSLRTLLSQANTELDRWQRSYELAQACQYYINDSTMKYLNYCVAIAEKLHRDDLMCTSKSDLAIQFSSAGMQAEAFAVLQTIKIKGVPKEKRIQYYRAYYETYNALTTNNNDTPILPNYKLRYNSYADTLISLLSDGDMMKLRLQEDRAIDNHDLDDALRLNNQRLSRALPGSRTMALVAYNRYSIYKEQNNLEEEKRWLAVSALCDIENVVMDQTALWTLASMLASEGDVDRAHLYIEYSWDAATLYGTTLKSKQLFPILNNIDKVYVNRLKSRSHQLFFVVACEAIMGIFLIILLYYNTRQQRELKATQNHLSSVNKEQETLNQQLDAALKQVNDANEKLTETNRQLQLSNHQKENYIGQYLGLCSLYIDKLDAYRQMVHRMVKNNQIDELFHLTRNTEAKEMELDELYDKFDAVFLMLYPNFVELFNSLLRPDSTITPQKSNRLNTPLRIYALMRLGMTDSSKIASFLHCTTATVYNYRAKVKAALAGDKDSIDQFIHAMPST